MKHLSKKHYQVTTDKYQVSDSFNKTLRYVEHRTVNQRLNFCSRNLFFKNVPFEAKNQRILFEEVCSQVFS